MVLDQGVQGCADILSWSGTVDAGRDLPMVAREYMIPTEISCGLAGDITL